MGYQSIFRPGLFEGQTIVISGGGSGIGRATAHELASLGAHVALAGRKLERLERVRDEILAAEGSAAAHVCNIRDEQQVAALFEAVLAERGTVHGLFNNGGGQFFSPAERITLKGWQAVVDTNLTGTFLMCREAFNRCMDARGGAIVNMLLDNSRGFPGMAHSAAARAGVENLTRTLAVEWAHAGVRVNAVSPGLIQSSGLETYGEAMRPLIEQVRRDIPAKRLGTEAEVAAAVTFLLSPAAAYISGATLRIDGAGSLWRKTWEIDEHDRTAPPFRGFVEE
jgi:citronellol/citronellal dehydrogenase